MDSGLKSYFNLPGSVELLKYSQRYIERYLDYKRRENLVDFNDVIINTVDDNFDNDRIPTFEVLIIDEAKKEEPGWPFWCNARTTAIGFYEQAGWSTATDVFDIPTAGPHVKMYF